MRLGGADVCQLPGVAAEEELAECAVSVHQVLYGQALPPVLGAWGWPVLLSGVSPSYPA